MGYNYMKEKCIAEFRYLGTNSRKFLTVELEFPNIFRFNK